jgi:hypothetical protein
MTGDLANALYLGLVLILAVANAAVWAPFFGAQVAKPLTDNLTDGASGESRNHLLRCLAYCRGRGWRGWALTLALIEGVRHPERPAAFVEGLRCAQPGTWLERVFAAELWRFDNVQNCRRAFEVLQQHGLDPRPHPNQEVNLMLRTVERRPRPQSPPLAIFSASTPLRLQRDPRIRLFAAADASLTPKVDAPPDQQNPDRSNQESRTR